MDAIFKALNDPARRAMLDSLRDEDGQTLQQLESQFDMSRFGVMKHLKVLEEAGLVVSRRKGRFKHHYLNALPLQEVIDRWIEPLIAKPAARGLLNLKRELERNDTMPAKPDFVMQTFIRCSQDALWDALIDPEKMAQYHFASSRIHREGDETRYLRDDGSSMLVCRDLELDPKSRIMTTFEPKWVEGASTSRVVYQIEPEGSHCKLTIEHYDLEGELEGISDGWARVSSGLKTWLESGKTARFTAEAAA